MKFDFGKDADKDGGIFGLLGKYAVAAMKISIAMPSSSINRKRISFFMISLLVSVVENFPLKVTLDKSETISGPTIYDVARPRELDKEAIAVALILSSGGNHVFDTIGPAV